MFVSTVKMRGRVENRQEILLTIEGIQKEVGLRGGCQSSLCYQDIQDENIFCLVNAWKTQDDLDRYLQSKIFAALLGIRSILVRAPEVKVLIEEYKYSYEDNERVPVH